MEGLAEYMSNSTIRKGQLTPGRVSKSGRRTRVDMVRGQLRITRWNPGTQLTLAEIKKAARAGKALHLAEMVDADLSDFVGERRGLYYGMSWLLVHFLRHGRESWIAEAFPSFLLYVAEGYPLSEAFETAYGTTIEAVEDEFRSYVAGF